MYYKVIIVNTFSKPINIILLIALYLQLSLGQWWSLPVNLGIQNADDVNPHTCRACVEPSCLVWESNTHGNWDILSRFVYWEYLTDTLSITVDTNSDINASVAIDYSNSCFWCVWQSDRTGNWDIFVSYGDSLNGWSVPYQLSSDTLEDLNPSVYVNLDTVWVIWNSPFGVGTAYYDGNGWSFPKYINGSWTSYDARPCISGHYNHPLVVWSYNSNIYFSECTDTTWSFPQQITNNNLSKWPEICSEVFPWTNESYGAWITWQCSLSIGNWEIFATDRDVFTNINQLTNNNYNDITPSPLLYLALGDIPPVTAFCSDSNGNNDISAYWDGWGIEPIDTNASDDSNPVLTQSGLHLWVYWQTDRNGDLDIYGRFIDMNNIEESIIKDINTNTTISIKPNPFSKNTIIELRLQNQTQRNLTIFDLAGREVKKLYFHKSQSIVTWNGTDHQNNPLPEGIYFIEVDGKITQKVIKVK